MCNISHAFLMYMKHCHWYTHWCMCALVRLFSCILVMQFFLVPTTSLPVTNAGGGGELRFLKFYFCLIRFPLRILFARSKFWRCDVQRNHRATFLKVFPLRNFTSCTTRNLRWDWKKRDVDALRLSPFLAPCVCSRVTRVRSHMCTCIT